MPEQLERDVPPAAFLSHSRDDAVAAGALARDLRANGIDVWYSEWEIKLGDSLRRKIDEGIDRASHFLVLLTPASLASEWVNIELDAGMVNRISGKCRLIPVLHEITSEQVPATLRGLRWVSLAPYADGLRKLIEVCHGVATKPPIGEAPSWAQDRPLEGAGLSPIAQRLAAWLNKESVEGHSYDLFDRDVILKALELTPEQAGLAASELEDEHMVKLMVDSGSGPARFSCIRPKPKLFERTDCRLRGWSTRNDAVELAAAMLNKAKSDGGVSLADVDQHLGWGPRRLNPAADYLADNGHVKPARSMGSKPYTYGYAFVGFGTQRFVDSRRRT